MTAEKAARARSRNPWMVVAGSGIAQSVSAQTMILTTFSLFVIPLADSTGWGRAAILAAFTSCAMGMAIGTPIVGRLLDFFALRPIVISAWTLYCAAVATLTFVPQTLPLFYLPYFLVGFFAAGALVPFTKAVVSWFDNKRGTAIGVMAALGGLGTTFTPLLASYIINSFGYRHAYSYLALVSFAVGLAVIVGFVRVRGERSQRGRLLSVVEREHETVSLELPGLTPNEAVATRDFWMIAFALCFAGIAVVGIQANLVPMLTSNGISAGQATVALSTFGFASLVGRLGGILLDRFHARIVGGIVLFLPVIGIGLLMVETSFATAIIGAVPIGLAFGMEIDLLAFLTSRYLGLRRFASLLGILQGAVILSLASGPLLVGIAYDVMGSYVGIMQILAVALALSAVAVFLLGEYRYPALAGFDKSAVEDELGASAALSRIAEQEDREKSAEESAVISARNGTPRR